jgi:uncharacterized protein (TIGR02001 family)
LPVLLAAVALGAVRVAAAQDASAGVNGYLTVASGYWSHGLSQADGPTLQLGVDYQHAGGFFAGAWAADVDYVADYAAADPRDSVVDVYAGYHRRTADWSWTGMVGRYVYPGTGAAYDYTEWSATVGYRDRLFYTASYSHDFYGWRRSSLNQEISFALPLRGDLELGGALGKFAVSDTSVDFTHWNLGLSKVVRRLVVDLRYYESGYAGAGYLGNPDADHYVLSLSYGLRGRRTKI